MDDKQILLEALKFHEHKCWANVAGARAGLAYLRVVGNARMCIPCSRNETLCQRRSKANHLPVGLSY